ncbi:MATE family efflux transporter [Halobellus captivus]|uniref:MATE family efflux transporter n=1 Tax=Halobellus captivus TaxID=2592614 RepID=UPI00119E7A1B|nr:MATE family efflux transporter [Halobellus captivus]
MGLVSRLFDWIADALERADVIARDRLRATFDLAWPRVVTGFSRMSQQTVDLAMVGLAVGPAGIAGLAFAYAYWQIGNKISLGISGGTISLVSQYYGGDDTERADQTITQSYVLATVFGIPLAVAFYFFSTPLIALMGAGSETVQYGAVYLATLAPALVFEFYTKIASRVFAGIGDTVTPMIIRTGGAIVNVFLNAVFIFGLGWGVVGAALGTAIATGVVSITFFWGLYARSYPFSEAIPVGFALGDSFFDPDLARPLLRVSTPLVLQELSRAVVVFPLLAIAAVFGPTTVAAFEIGRRIRDLVNSLAWGYSIAASSLVGRYLGSDAEGTAAAYGREIIRLTVLSFVILAVLVAVFARPIAGLFANDPGTIEQTVPFVRIGAVAAIALGIDRSATGALRGAGDTSWPFYGSLIGLYAFALPVAYLSVVTSLGIAALYLALLVETSVPAGITLYRYQTGTWRSISRSIRQAH